MGIRTKILLLLLVIFAAPTVSSARPAPTHHRVSHHKRVHHRKPKHKKRPTHKKTGPTTPTSSGTGNQTGGGSNPTQPSGASNPTPSGTGTPTPPAPAPENVSSPSFTGVPALGQTLACTPGVWQNASKLVYRWDRGLDSPTGFYSEGYAGAGASYTVQSADLEHVLRCTLTASNASGREQQASAPLAVIQPQNTSSPSITGTLRQGETLTCAVGGWNGIGTQTTSSYSHAWLRDGSPIPGANGAQYQAQAQDVGHTLSCQVSVVAQPDLSPTPDFEPWPGMSVSAPVTATSAGVSISACYANQAPYCVAPPVGEVTNDITVEEPLVAMSEVQSGLLHTHAVRTGLSVEQDGTLQVDLSAPAEIEVQFTYCYTYIYNTCGDIYHFQTYSLPAGHSQLSFADNASAPSPIHRAMVGVIVQPGGGGTGGTSSQFDY